ncbi:RidA family protein [Georgenia thermotolerans]|uniref:RidA family protein n=1 Tax=Georgenia thermotolerans TaxID=527326 RepID=A0A7J5UMN1_9MICO|nr:RidA family protein [Georgenia thermotolerans]KAE8763364.1 RidA family protein [Georgenia thermotolerans]
MITHLNPATLHHNPAFSQGVLLDGPGRLLVVGGQNGVGPDGQVVAADVHAQTAQALRNVLAVLAAAGATQEHVVKMTVHLVAGADVAAGYAAAQEVWGAHPTALTVLQVAGLGRPECLVEIEALAYLPAA